MLNYLDDEVNQMCNTDYDQPDLYRERVGVARKAHSCTECGRRIGAGESYRRVFGVWHGDAYLYKVCQHCNIALIWLLAECRGFLFHGIQEDILDHAREAPAPQSVALYRIAIGMSRGWRGWRSASFPLPRLPMITARQGAFDYV